MAVGNVILGGYGTTIFEVMSSLARETGSVNLGQGFPDDQGPEDVRAEAARQLMEGWNQYAPMMGVDELRQAVAGHARQWYGIEADWHTEVMVTSGATEALAACLLGLINPGDEVVLFEPLYDSYLPMVHRAGGVPRFVPLNPPDWSFTDADLEAAFSERTRVVMLNTPLNPAGKVFSADELTRIANAMEAVGAVAICDEVYEHLVFDGRRHVPLMTIPGMRGQCLRIGSAGKTFSLTGWKVGYVTAAPELLRPVAKAHQFLTFTTAPNLQHGVALGLNKDDAYFHGLTSDMQERRDRLEAGLSALGFNVLRSQGTYFLVADYRQIEADMDDAAFCKHLTHEAGVTAIPVSAFFENTAPDGWIRFCFCKSEAVIDEGLARLKAWLG